MPGSGSSSRGRSTSLVDLAADHAGWDIVLLVNIRPVLRTLTKTRAQAADPAAGKRSPCNGKRAENSGTETLLRRSLFLRHRLYLRFHSSIATLGPNQLALALALAVGPTAVLTRS